MFHSTVASRPVVHLKTAQEIGEVNLIHAYFACVGGFRTEMEASYYFFRVSFFREKARNSIKNVNLIKEFDAVDIVLNLILNFNGFGYY